jgi:hypothetical protein
MARPKLQLNEKDIYDLAAIGCTYEEIANLVGCDKSTLEKSYSAIIKSGHDSMKQSLRRERLKIAFDPNHKQQATMLIFLSKVILGEKEYAVIDDGRSAPKIKIEFSE